MTEFGTETQVVQKHVPTENCVLVEHCNLFMSVAVRESELLAANT